MKRAINEKEYQEIAKENPEPFNIENMLIDEIVEVSSHWIVLKNKYPYVQYESQKVDTHLLIVPKRDNVTQLWQLTLSELSELPQVLQNITRDYAEELNKLVFWKVKGKSINKLHFHYLILERSELL